MSGTSTPRQSATNGSTTPILASPPDKSGHVGNMDEKQKETLDTFERRLCEADLMPADLMEDGVQKDVVLR